MVLDDFRKRFRSKGRTALKIGAGIMGAGVVGLGLAGAIGGGGNQVQDRKYGSAMEQKNSIDNLLKEYNNTYNTNLGGTQQTEGLGGITGIEQATHKFIGNSNVKITKTPGGATFID